MAFIAGFGGILTFSGVTAVSGVIPVRSFTLNVERASLDFTQLSDYREKRLPGRIRRSGTMTIYRQDGSADDTLRSHLFPNDLTGATVTNASLTLKYVDQGSKSFDEWGSGTNAFNIHITAASVNDDGTGPAVWELTWEEQ
jgi:hypothetical protein